MIKLIKAAAVFAVVVAVLGVFSIYVNGRTVDLTFADGHDSPPPDCCDAPPPDDSPPPEEYYEPPPDDSYSEPPPDDSYYEPPPEGDYVECTDCTYVEPPPDGEYFECTDCTFDQPPPEFYDCTDCTFDQPPLEFYDCVDCTFDQPPPEFYDCVDCIFDYSSFQGAYLFEGEYNVQSDKFLDPALSEGSFTFDPNGAFIFDGGNYVEGGDNFFPDGEFYEFFDPGDFAHDEFVTTFNPDAFAGDFGDFFQGGDFGTGEFEQFFDPGDFRPEEFGTFFQFGEFDPGDFGNFAAIGDGYVDFGGHFDLFWGERSEDAQFASDFFAGFDPGEFGFVPPEELLGELQNLDYQGFQNLDPDFVQDLFQVGLDGQEFDLQGDQWAGAFSQFDVEAIYGFDQDFIGGAILDFAPEDFLGIPSDQAFALFESAFFGGSFDGGPPPDFDPSVFEGKLDEFGDQLSGFLGAFGQDHYQQIEDGQLVDIFSRIDFAAPDFDRDVLDGDDLRGIFGALDYESFAGLGDQQILDAIGVLEAKDFGAWDPTAAFNVFDNIEFGQVVDFEYLDGLVGAMGFEELQNLDGDKLVGLIDSFAFGGPDFDLSVSALDGADIAGLIGSLDGDHLGELGGDGILDAIQYLNNQDLGIWDGGAAFGIFAAIGFDQAKGLEQFEGIVGNFATDQIEQLGDQLAELLGELDFQNNGEILRDFSFDTLGVLTPEDFQGLGVRQLVDLANTTGGDGIVGLDPGQIQNIIGSIQADFFEEFDPSVVGGLFAGLDHDQIGGFDHEILEAALEAAGANLLGGLGDFDAIAGASTAFDELANLAGFETALEQDGSFVIQDGVFDFFGGNLFGSN